METMVFGVSPEVSGPRLGTTDAFSSGGGDAMQLLSGLRGARRESRIAGVPSRTGLGDSKKEALALLGGVLVLAIIFLSFWFAATH